MKLFSQWTKFRLPDDQFQSARNQIPTQFFKSFSRKHKNIFESLKHFFGFINISNLIKQVIASKNQSSSNIRKVYESFWGNQKQKKLHSIPPALKQRTDRRRRRSNERIIVGYIMIRLVHIRRTTEKRKKRQRKFHSCHKSSVAWYICEGKRQRHKIYFDWWDITPEKDEEREFPILPAFVYQQKLTTKPRISFYAFLMLYNIFTEERGSGVGNYLNPSWRHLKCFIVSQGGRKTSIIFSPALF